ncbi:hypothetical protein ACFQE8_09485 [Salinirubellus sp. GCM10025818]|uniref:hypothetical protein n=1 Tax=Salinirubellus TaxID=2162630 RepID=UPI0030D4330D
MPLENGVCGPLARYRLSRTVGRLAISPWSVTAVRPPFSTRFDPTDVSRFRVAALRRVTDDPR